MVADLPRAIAGAGFDIGTPVSVAVIGPDGTLHAAAGGIWPGGLAVVTSDRFYLASLAKQVTGAAIALLVRDKRLDPDAPLSRLLPELPAWADGITVRQLLHHTSGLPAAGGLETALSFGRWTTAYALEQLRDLQEMPTAPDVAHVYSNVGYILLAAIVARVSGAPFSAYATDLLFRPLGLSQIGFATEPDPTTPQWAMLGPVLPCSVGDGGLWSAATDFARWLAMMNGDDLDIADLVAQPGQLSDGTAIDYGWGIGLRQRDGRPLYLHGGSWTGARARAVRMPDPGFAIVALAACDEDDPLTQLVERLLGELL